MTMYADYWQLDAKPFEPSPEAEMYFPSEAHEGALLKLRYAVEQRRAAAALAGPSGVGKTLLVERLLDGLDDWATPVARIVFPQMTPSDLLAYVADALAAPLADAPRYSTDESIARIERALADNAAEGRHALVVIDEAHLLEDSGLIETIRLLLNVAGRGTPRATLLLVGQMGLLSAVARAPGLEERLSVKSLIRTFVEDETIAYLGHRLQAAGASRELFTAGAVHALHQLSGGAPRKIDRLGDLALLVGYANGLSMVDEEHVRSVSDELLAVAPE